jgi:hypothetical protein
MGPGVRRDDGWNDISSQFRAFRVTPADPR